MKKKAITPYLVILSIILVIDLALYLSPYLTQSQQDEISQADKSQAQADPCQLGSANANLVTVTSPPGYTFSVNCIVNASVMYDQDPRYTFFQTPAVMGTIPYIKTPNAQVKDNPTLPWYITLSRPSQLFILTRKIPGTQATLPSWAGTNYTRITPDTFTDLSQYLLRKNATNGLIGLYDVWRSNSSTLNGRVDFGPASNNVQTSPAYSMYVVAIKPGGSNPSSTPNPSHTVTPAPSGTGKSLVTSGVTYNADSSAHSSRAAVTTIKLPETLIPVGQGWMAARMKMGFPSTTTLSPDPNILDMSQSDANSLFLYYNVGGGNASLNTFHFERFHGTTVASAPQVFGVGALKTVVAAWTPSQIKLSVDGSPFTVLANNNALAQSSFYIGSSAVQGAKRQPESDYYWVAGGSGTLTDADAQTINNFGNTDHARADYPGAATFMWDASSDRYNTR